MVNLCRRNWARFASIGQRLAKRCGHLRTKLLPNENRTHEELVTLLRRGGALVFEPLSSRGARSEFTELLAVIEVSIREVV